ncbi:MAG: hypothetical protein CMJ77_15960 [Planctomycetaceae bacterium]|nr:hypothetical protein [Planctomycetaceae bacterium]
MKKPFVQIALDYPSVEEALTVAEIGVAAGVDILEAGTPLIVAEGIRAIGELARAFPDMPVLADYKTMDSGFKNVQLTKAQGGHYMTVCANAPDATVQSAIREGKTSGIQVVVDTIGVPQQAERAKTCADWAWTGSIFTMEPINVALTAPATPSCGSPRCFRPSIFRWESPPSTLKTLSVQPN